MIFPPRSDGARLYLSCEARDTYVPSLGLESRIWDTRRLDFTGSMQNLTAGSQNLFGSEFRLSDARSDSNRREYSIGETNRGRAEFFALPIPPLVRLCCGGV